MDGYGFRKMIEEVFVLSHCYDEDDIDTYKIIGVFRSYEDAQQAVEKFKKIKGFKNYQDSFCIDTYPLNEMFWLDGFG